MMRRVLCLLGVVAALCGLVPAQASAQSCPSGQLDFDYDLGTLDELLGNVLVDEQNVNLWLNGNPPVWQNIPGQVGPGFVDVDNDGNGINDDDHFDLLAAVINGSDTEVVQNLNPATVQAIRNAFAANKVRVRETAVTLCNVKIKATASVITVNRTICVTTGQQACVDVPIAGNQCFDVPPLWGPDGILADVDPALEERMVNLAAGYMTIGDPAGITYFQNVLGQVTLAALVALVPQLLADLKSVDKDVSCEVVTPIHVETDQDLSGISAHIVIDVAASDICTALNNFINGFNCNNGFSCQASALGATGNLNASGPNNKTSYINAATRQQWMIAEGITNPPLQISQNPGNATVESGTPTTFSFTHQGGKAGGRSFKWDTIDAEAYAPVATVSTSENLTFNYPLAGDSNLYTGVVCDGLWQRRTQPFRLTVNTGTFRIVTQPVGASGRVPGTPYTFTVAVRGGTTVPSYQWQFDNGQGGGFVNVGPNSPTFEIPSLDLPDTGTYRVVVTGSTTITSNEVQLQVVDSIRFQTQPAAQAVYVGTQVSFTPVIIGQPVGTLNYQWLKGGNPIDGQTSATLTIPSAQLSDNGDYRLRIYDDTYDVLSDVAHLEVALQPTFSVQPQGGAGFEGNSFTFNVQVSGGLTFLNYQWYFQADGSVEDPVAVGTNSPSLFIDDLLPANQGNYFVTVTDRLQTITSNNAFLEIFPPFEIVEQPQGAVKFIGDGHTFTVGIEGGTGTIHYQWYKGNDPVGTDNPSLTINPLSLADSGSYRVVVSDDNGSNTSQVAVLDVRKQLAITKQPVNIGVYLGRSLTFSIDSEGGIGNIVYRWKRGPVVIGLGKNLVIPEATLATNGQYYCEVSDDFSTITSNTFTVTAVAEVTFSTQPQNVYRFVGDSATFTCAATGGLGTLKYRWLKDNVELPNEGPVLLLEKVFLADNGVYRCEVTDDLFTTSSEGAQLFVFEEPGAEGLVVTTHMTNTQVVPPTDVDSNGDAFGYLTPLAGSANGDYHLEMNVVHDVPAVRFVRIRKGVVGENGPGLLVFDSAISPTSISRDLTRAQAAELMGGYYYLIVESAGYTLGAIRGQLNVEVPEPEGEVVTPCSNAVTGTLTACSAHYNRIGSGPASAACNGTSTDSTHDNMPYNAIKFTWLGTGKFTASVTAGGTDISDTVLSLYCDPFNPATPGANLISFDDDGGPNTPAGLSEITALDNVTLTQGNTYWLVISTFRGATTPLSGIIPEGVSGDFGAYRICLPAGATVLSVEGGGGDDCIGVGPEGEGTPEGGVEGNPEGGVEGGEEGVIEGNPEGVEEGEGIVEEGEGVAEGEGETSRRYSADVNANGVIDLEELLRVIQLFNAGAYFCSDSQLDEDGYSLINLGIAFGTPGCEPHTADYQLVDVGQIVLSELLRVIQFFNLGGVVPCPGEAEDGYCVPEG